MRYQLCSQGYLRTFGVRLARGRDFTEDDVAGARRVALVNETLAATHFPVRTRSAGRSSWPGCGPCPIRSAEPVFEIVGVTRDARNGGLRGDPEPAAFLPSTTSGLRQAADRGEEAADPRFRSSRCGGRCGRSTRPRALAGPGLDEVLRERYYAQPRFSLIVLATSPPSGCCWSRSACTA
jgi:hypothetical protein